MCEDGEELAKQMGSAVQAHDPRAGVLANTEQGVLLVGEGEMCSLLGCVGDKSCVCYTPRGNPKSWGPERHAAWHRRQNFTLRAGLRLSEVAFPGTRKQVLTPSLLSQQGGLPPAHTAQVCRDMAGDLQREPELCRMGRHRHDSMTFFNHPVCCNKWNCPRQQ